MNINPDIWGPSGWKVLHRMAYTFADIHEAREFFTSFADILPCKKCRDAYQSHLAFLPFPRSVKQIGKWVYSIHNRVNDSRNGNTKNRPTYDEIEHMYRPNHFNDEEWIFVEAIAKAYPGKLRASAAYKNSIRKFMNVWVETVPGHENYKFNESKVQMLSWIKKQMITANVKQQFPSQKQQCNDSYCVV